MHIEVTANGGPGSEQLALFSLRLIFLKNGKLICHSYSVISEDVKEDTFHAWAHLRALLLQVI